MLHDIPSGVAVTKAMEYILDQSSSCLSHLAYWPSFTPKSTTSSTTTTTTGGESTSGVNSSSGSSGSNGVVSSGACPLPGGLTILYSDALKAAVKVQGIS